MLWFYVHFCWTKERNIPFLIVQHNVQMFRLTYCLNGTMQHWWMNIYCDRDKSVGRLLQKKSKKCPQFFVKEISIWIDQRGEIRFLFKLRKSTCWYDTQNPLITKNSVNTLRFCNTSNTFLNKTTLYKYIYVVWTYFQTTDLTSQ